MEEVRSIEVLTVKELYVKLEELLLAYPEYGDYSITIPCECGYSSANPIKVNGKCFRVKEEWRDVVILSDDDDDEENYKRMGYILL